MSASIVGSGELIATTILGAKAGFIAFWVIIVSCLIKVAVQLEFGKKAILSGETMMSSFNKLPGFRIGNSNWTVWTIFILIFLKIVQLGGMIGGTALVLHLLFPGLPINISVFLIVVASSALIYRGNYKIVEIFSLLMIAAFTLTTLAAVFFLRYTEFSISWTDISEGLKFKLPASIVAVAFGAFGITGVARVCRTKSTHHHIHYLC